MKRKETLNISGMSCAACAARIEKSLSKIEGVKEANVNLALEKATVAFDDEVANDKQLRATIRKLGYEVIEEQSQPEGQVELKISGMSCAACSAKIEKKLVRTEGVSQAAVNLATEKALVVYDKNRIGLSDLVQIIEKLGYRAEPSQEISRDREKEARDKEIRSLRNELMVAAILSSPLILAMVLSLLNLEAAFLHNQYFQLAIATPVQFIIGFRFYKNAWYALRSGSANMDVLIAMGTSAAYFYSLYNVFYQRVPLGMMKDLYFEASAVIITLILVGKYLEAVAKGKTSEAIKKLMGLSPKTARVVRDEQELDIPIDEVKIGDLIMEKSWPAIPLSTNPC